VNYGCFIYNKIVKNRLENIEFPRRLLAFCQKEHLPYPRTVCDSFWQNIPSFFLVCQPVDRFIDRLRGSSKNHFATAPFGITY